MKGSGMEDIDLAADTQLEEGNRSLAPVWILFPKFLELKASKLVTQAQHI